MTFDSLLRPIKQVLSFFFMSAIWRSGNKEKTYTMSLSSSLSARLSFSAAINIRYGECVLVFFPLLFVFISLPFWTNPVCRDLIASIRAGAQEKSLSSVESVNHLTLTAALPQREPSPLHFPALLQNRLRWLCFYCSVSSLWGIVAISVFIVSECVLL